VTLFRIGTAARLAGVGAETIRTWERRYGLAPSGRTAGKQRLYSLEDVERLRVIKAATSSGLSAGEAHNVVREKGALGDARGRLGDILHSPVAHQLLADPPGMGRRADRERIPLRARALMNATWDSVYRMSPDWTEMRALAGRGFLTDTARPNASWLDQYIEPRDQPRVLTLIGEAVDGVTLFQLEHRVRCRDGSVGWTLSRAVPLLERGVIMEWVGVALDITARHEPHDTLSRSEQRLRRVFETDAVGLVFFDHLGTVIDANEVFLHTTGYTREDIEARQLTWRAMMPADSGDGADSDLKQIADRGSVGPNQRECLCRDGSRKWMLLCGRDLEDGTICEYYIDIDSLVRGGVERLGGGTAGSE
jgi:PAS domain S-box-containing protein